MSAFINYGHKISLILICMLIPFAHSALSQIYVDDTLFVGNNDGSPFHVPYQGVVDIPLWLNEIYEGSTGAINLATSNYAVSERLDGNFYYPWYFIFYPPIWHQDYSAQSLWFTARNPPDSVGHLADFTIRMALDTSCINDTLQILNANVQFSDSTGYVLILYGLRISPIVIDDITAIDEETAKPEDIAISRIYPNPFNSSATIEFSLDKPQFVALAIYDLLGREINTLLESKKPSGTHRIFFDASGLSSGVYFYRLRAGNIIETKRMVLLK
ncbi:MAG: T9SS type A sorting domain-containing protein [Candidatus Zixiibacteriota bacterium]|nr:MAG: T9SS type A sorting domain-containing protein [candidate division Zixibacteria bacterium]